MTLPAPRDPETRKADSLKLLTTDAIDVWVATASVAGAPYLVPVSLAWVDDRALSDDGDKPGHTQLRRFFDQPVEPLPRGNCGGQGQSAGQNPVGQPGSEAADDLDLAEPDAEVLGDEPAHGHVGLIVDRRGRDPHDQAARPVLTRAGLSSRD